MLNVNKLSWISEASQQFVFEGVLGGSSGDFSKWLITIVIVSLLNRVDLNGLVYPTLTNHLISEKILQIGDPYTIVIKRNLRGPTPQKAMGICQYNKASAMG